MCTRTLQMLEPPSQVDVLLRELVQSRGIVPEGTYEIRDRTSLPTALRRLAQNIRHTADQSWACWLSDDGHTWFFFIAEMPSSLSSERGKPVLQINQYGEDGVILYTGQWVADAAGKWMRCTAVRSGGVG